jgi:hypothetical protein
MHFYTEPGWYGVVCLMADNPVEPPPSGILRSNVDAHVVTEASRERRAFPITMVLVALVTFVAGGLTVLLLTGRTTPQPQAAAATAVTAARPTPTLASNSRSRAAAPAGAPLPSINGISCDALESTIFHIHVHLAIFFDGDEQSIPFGVGIGQPWQVSGSDQGPFVNDGSCFYWMHTHTEDGVIHIESPVRRSFTLGDFFAVWQEPLSASQVGPQQGQVITYVNGQRDSTNPSDIRLTSHQRIQLDVGADVPPYSFDFPPGD